MTFFSRSTNKLLFLLVLVLQAGNVWAADFGDVPGVLTCVDADIGTYPIASHTGTTNHLGTAVSDEAETKLPNSPCPGGGAPNLPPDADGDDFDDGVAFPLVVSGSGPVLRVTEDNGITVTATADGFLSAWIDLNRDGDWSDTGEQLFTNQGLLSGANNLTITAAQLPATTPHGATYMRFRFCTTSGTCSTPDGTAPTGEVEDYRVFLALPDPSDSTVCETSLINDSFETPIVATATATDPAVIQIFVAGQIVAFRESDVIGWAFNSVSASSGSGFDQRNGIELWNNNSTAAPGEPDAYDGNQFAEINAFVFGDLYQDLVATPGTVLKWHFAHRARGSALGQTDRMALKIGVPGATVKQADFTSGNQLAQGCSIGNELGGSGALGITATASIATGSFWCVYEGTYTVTGAGLKTITRFQFEAEATGAGSTSVGNFVDAISLNASADHGDAPTNTYGSACSMQTASGPFLGTLLDFEAVDSGGSAAANIDDITDTDDEDGVVFSTPAGGGDNIIASVMVNPTGSSITLCAWMDVNENGAFENTATERQCDTRLNPSGDFEWIVDSVNTGTYFTRFRVCSTATDCNNPTGLSKDGEVEDYVLTYNPTQVTIGEFGVSFEETDALLAALAGDAGILLDMLAYFDPDTAEGLAESDAATIAAVLVGYLDPDGDGRVALVRWTTLEEQGTAGFFIERREGEGTWSRVSDDMLPGLINAPYGGEYRLFDPQARAGMQYEYRLIELEVHGARRSYGPYPVEMMQ